MQIQNAQNQNQQQTQHSKPITLTPPSLINPNTSQIPSFQQQFPLLLPTTQTYYNIPILHITQALYKKHIKKCTFQSQQSQSILTTIYSCKLNFLSTYNYHIAINLQQIINKIDEIGLIAQVLTIPIIKNTHQQHIYEEQAYQIIFRLEKFIDQSSSLQRNIQNKFTCDSLECFVKKHFSIPVISSPLKPSRNAFSEQFLLKIDRNSIIDYEKNRLSFCVKNDQIQDIEFLLIYELNWTMNQMLRDYKLDDNVQKIKFKFKYAIRNAIDKYQYMLSRSRVR